MKSLTKEDRWKIVFTYKLTRNIDRTAKSCCVTPEAVRRWWGRYCETGGVGTKPSTGIKTQVSSDTAHTAAKLLASQDYDGAEHVARELHKLGGTKHKLSKSHCHQACKAGGSSGRCTTGGVEGQA